MKNIFILTDLEGAAGVTSFSQTREKGAQRDAAMELLTAEINAVLRGITNFDPEIKVHLWDGHGSGGIVKKRLFPVSNFIPSGRINMVSYFKEHSIDALLFVGQHAMSYTVHGNLCHTMSSRNIEYYSLNGRLIGEFGLRATIAGEIGVPTIYLTGDDKACQEAKKLIPEIVTTETKRGTGWESAISRDIKEVHEAMEQDVQEALTRGEAGKIKTVRINHPVVLEIYVRNWFNLAGYLTKGARGKGTRTAIFKAQSMQELVEKKVL